MLTMLTKLARTGLGPFMDLRLDMENITLAREPSLSGALWPAGSRNGSSVELRPMQLSTCRSDFPPKRPSLALGKRPSYASSALPSCSASPGLDQHVHASSAKPDLRRVGKSDYNCLRLSRLMDMPDASMFSGKCKAVDQVTLTSMTNAKANRMALLGFVKNMQASNEKAEPVLRLNSSLQLIEALIFQGPPSHYAISYNYKFQALLERLVLQVFDLLSHHCVLIAHPGHLQAFGRS